METLVLLIAALILAAGIALWSADARAKKASSRARSGDAPDLVEEQEADEVPAPDTDAGSDYAPEAAPKPSPEVEPTPEPVVEKVPEKVVAHYDDEVSDLDDEVEAGLAAVPEVAESALEVKDIEPEPEPEVTPRAHAPVSTTVREEEQGVEKHSFLQSLPGSQRRERRHWASKHGFDFIKEDAFLTDEWSRGAASTGAVARDVASGIAEGYETHLVDLAGVPVMAMRRGRNSEVVIDARRATLTIDPERNDSDDLLEVETVSGFTLLSNMAGVAQRFVDERVQVAFEAMPEAVTAVWFESDWVLAETTKGSTAEDWDNILQPLALLTDASFTLPPRSQDKSVNLALIEPTRPKPDTPDDPREPSPEQEVDLTQPLVIRPEEPLQMPVRGVQESRGVVEPRALGADDVDSIADGQTTQNYSDYNGTRVLRNLSGRSSIFDDVDEDTTPPEPEFRGLPTDWKRNLDPELSRFLNSDKRRDDNRDQDRDS